MRHLWSFLAGLVAAPLAWLLLATGQYRSQQTVADWNAAGSFDTAELIGPAGFLAAAGIVLGIIGTLRWSPLGPAVAGLLLIVPTGFLFYHPFRTLDALSVDEPRRVLGQDLQLWLPVQNGTLLVLGGLLLMAVFSGRRWRRWPETTAVTAPVTEPAVAPPVPDDRQSEPTTQVPITEEEILAAARAMEQEAATKPES